MNTEKFVADLNTRFFNSELSELLKKQLLLLPVNRPDVFSFVERVFSFMNSAGVPAKDVSLFAGGVLGSLLARILPGAWEGRIPPITMPGRHAVIDRYIQSGELFTTANKTMLDVGCGFPPSTTLDSAKNLSDWHITGIDPSFPEYLVYDTDQSYATLDKSRSTIYFQPAIPSLESWNRFLNDAEATKKRFENLLEELLHGVRSTGSSYARIEVNPVMDYETDRLSFIRGGIGHAVNEPKGVIRCFNVLAYFNDDFFAKALSWFTNTVQENGIVIIGGNWAASTECYYNVYQKNGGVLINKEFSFGLDCINPIGICPWFASYDDYRQTNQLVKYIGMIRSDKAFMDEYYAFNDDQRARYAVCARDEQGYYAGVDPEMDPARLWTTANRMIQELNDAGFNQKAVKVLKRSGLHARVNEVGHVAIIG
jgi:hypothetical protein